LHFFVIQKPSLIFTFLERSSFIKSQSLFFLYISDAKHNSHLHPLGTDLGSEQISQHALNFSLSKTKTKATKAKTHQIPKWMEKELFFLTLALIARVRSPCTTWRYKYRESKQV